MSGFAIPCQRNDIYHRIEESRAVGRLPMRGTRFAEVIEIIEKGQSLYDFHLLTQTYQCVTEVQLGGIVALDMGSGDLQGGELEGVCSGIFFG